MDEDEELCLCFHVSLRKIKNFIRIEKPKRASQISQCFGAGTGCGWCRPWLAKLLEKHQQRDGSVATTDERLKSSVDHDVTQIDPERYATDRLNYRRDRPPKRPER